MSAKRRRPARKGGGKALQRGGRKHRKVVFTLPPERVVEQCLKDGRDLICAGQVLAVQKLMQAAGWPIAVLAKRAHVSVSHLSEFLRLKKFLTCQLMRRIAGAFGLKLSQVDHLAEDLAGC